MKIDTAYQTDRGTIKDVNQDALLIKTARCVKGNIAFFCICDGMGGLSQGEMASTHVIYAMSDWFDHRLPGLLEKDNPDEVIKEELFHVIGQTNAQLREYGMQNRLQLGTTCTAALVLPDFYYVVHVGDTRLYEITDAIRQITHDQTVLAREISLGRVLPQNAQNDTRGSVLLQCIGASKTVEPEFIVRKTKRGAVLMLCTDGFRNKVSDLEFLDGFHPKFMTDERVMEKQCEYFVELGKQRMERDNLTVLLAKIW
ncbi:MAG: serine/threonine-protein phosphatase [Lachnospiraceae bacterium]|nr:serine/threonine-protein phosphatase [Lachnospiraceae bacterium]